MELDESMANYRTEAERVRLLALARLRRTKKPTLAALGQVGRQRTDPAIATDVESVVPLWLGRKEVAVERLEKDSPWKSRQIAECSSIWLAP